MGLFSPKKTPSSPTISSIHPPSSVSEEKMTEISSIIRTADSLNDLLIHTAQKTREAIHADRLTIYVVDSANNIISSRIKDGDEVKSIAIPMSNSSIAGYTAKNTKVVNIKDAYDAAELQKNYPDLHFDRSWDQRTGYRTKEVVSIPVVLKGKIQGVIQAINKKTPSPDGGFGASDLQTIQQISDTLAPDLYKIKSFEDSQRDVEFQKKIKRLTDKIHSSTNFEEMLFSVTADLEGLFEVGNITVYMMDKATNELIAHYRDKDKTEEIRIGFDNNSIAGFAAKNNRVLKIDDVYNDSELIKISPEIRFDKRWDEKFNKRTKSVLSFPLIFGGEVQGVIQLINKKNGLPFSDKDIETTREIATTLAIALNRQKKVVSRISKYDALVSANLISPEKLDSALKKAKESGDTLEHILITEHSVSPTDIGKCYGYYFRADFIGFMPEMEIPMDLLQGLALETLKNELWVPVSKKGATIKIAMDDPRDVVKRDNIQIRFKSANIVYGVSTKDDIIKIIDYFFGVSKSDVPTEKDVVDILDELKGEVETAEKDEGKEELKEDDSAIVRLVNQIIEQAYARRASDIHIEPYTERDTIVRLRIDGSCQEFMKVPKHYKNALVSRIKIMSNLDISDRRLPQDGKIKFKNFGKLDIELRVATIPTVGGNEDVVMRVLASSKPIPLDKLGMNPHVLSQLKAILDRPYGLCLVVGPTGSGKTTTLHSALGHINTPDMKIWTAEDPVEITQYQLRQVQVHTKIGFTFDRAMRSFLRCDPDVIMVGEMRDLETVSTGVEASLTGHLVFSTLHTNNAPETVTRLLEFGIDPFSFADALLGILAQRLVRTLCVSCKEEYHPTKEEFETVRIEYANNELFDSQFKYSKDLVLYRPAPDGCKECNGRGYRGRMGIYELLVSSDGVKSLVHKKPTPAQLTELAVKEGMTTLKQDGIEKALKGFSTLKEVLSVCMK
ncbi:MAG: ATPase, T2SS/T4P/T4SS family [Planctomycetota bacterium]|nr:ATPase, T2SS/T4P/T4SS family [Planctomycetota bacterium]MDI6786834.1 ATPase, T2SS/T4P/T4SS family [Planctomycetota bacterium]